MEVKLSTAKQVSEIVGFKKLSYWL